eukprot:tig00020801_g13941.t1
MEENVPARPPTPTPALLAAPRAAPPAGPAPAAPPPPYIVPVWSRPGAPVEAAWRAEALRAGYPAERWPLVVDMPRARAALKIDAKPKELGLAYCDAAAAAGVPAYLVPYQKEFFSRQLGAKKATFEFFIFREPSDVLALTAVLPPERRCLYETYAKGSKLRIFFDVDVDRALNPGIDDEAWGQMLGGIMRATVDTLERACGREAPRVDGGDDVNEYLTLIDSTSATKYSAHIVVSERLAWCASTADHRALHAAIEATYLEHHARDAESFPLVRRAVTKPEGPAFVEEIPWDRALFADASRNFRLPWSTKAGRSAPLVPVRLVPDPEGGGVFVPSLWRRVELERDPTTGRPTAECEALFRRCLVATFDGEPHLCVAVRSAAQLMPPPPGRARKAGAAASAPPAAPPAGAGVGAAPAAGGPAGGGAVDLEAATRHCVEAGLLEAGRRITGIYRRPEGPRRPTILSTDSTACPLRNGAHAAGGTQHQTSRMALHVRVRWLPSGKRPRDGEPGRRLEVTVERQCIHDKCRELVKSGARSWPSPHVFDGGALAREFAKLYPLPEEAAAAACESDAESNASAQTAASVRSTSSSRTSARSRSSGGSKRGGGGGRRGGGGGGGDDAEASGPEDLAVPLSLLARTDFLDFIGKSADDAYVTILEAYGKLRAKIGAAMSAVGKDPQFFAPLAAASADADGEVREASVNSYAELQELVKRCENYFDPLGSRGGFDLFKVYAQLREIDPQAAANLPFVPSLHVLIGKLVCAVARRDGVKRTIPTEAEKGHPVSKFIRYHRETFVYEEMEGVRTVAEYACRACREFPTIQAIIERHGKDLEQRLNTLYAVAELPDFPLAAAPEHRFVSARNCLLDARTCVAYLRPGYDAPPDADPALVRPWGELPGGEPVALIHLDQEMDLSGSWEAERPAARSFSSMGVAWRGADRLQALRTIWATQNLAEADRFVFEALAGKTICGGREPDKVIPHFIGNADTGKNVVLRTVTRSIPRRLQFKIDGQCNKTYSVINWAGKMLVWSDEAKSIPEGVPRDALFSALCFERITADRKYLSQYTFDPTANFMFASNGPISWPKNTFSRDEWVKKDLVIPFDVPPKRQDQTLDAQCEAQQASITRRYCLAYRLLRELKALHGNPGILDLIDPDSNIGRRMAEMQTSCPLQAFIESKLNVTGVDEYTELEPGRGRTLRWRAGVQHCENRNPDAAPPGTLRPPRVRFQALYEFYRMEMSRNFSRLEPLDERTFRRTLAQVDKRLWIKSVKLHVPGTKGTTQNVDMVFGCAFKGFDDDSAADEAPAPSAPRPDAQMIDAATGAPVS